MRIIVDGDVEIVTEKPRSKPPQKDDWRAVYVFGAILFLCGVALWLG